MRTARPATDVVLLEITAQQAAAFVGVSAAQFHKYIHSDDPPPRLENGKFRSDQLGRWLIERTRRKYEVIVSDDPNRINAAHEKARKDKEQADKVALENQVRRGELVEASEIEAAWAMILMRVKTRLMSIPSALAPMLAIEDDRATCQELIDERVREALSELAASWADVDAPDPEG